MGEHSKIAWTDHTFNPWIGCTNVSAGCDNCYAEALMDGRLGRVKWGHGQSRSRTQTWDDPPRWDRKARARGERVRVFCASLADVFDSEVSDGWRHELFDGVIYPSTNIDWLLLTKRPHLAKQYFRTWRPSPDLAIPPWLGTSIESQDVIERIDQLWLAREATSVYESARFPMFLSMEPLLGPVDITQYLNMEYLDWVIVGGESGPNFRPMDPDWAREIRDVCADHDIPFFMKQMSSARKDALIPPDLQIRQTPFQNYQCEGRYENDFADAGCAGCVDADRVRDGEPGAHGRWRSLWCGGLSNNVHGYPTAGRPGRARVRR